MLRTRFVFRLLVLPPFELYSEKDPLLSRTRSRGTV